MSLASHIRRHATERPDTAAIKIPRGTNRDGSIDYLTLSWAELEGELDAWVARLDAAGVRPGDRTLVMVRQGLPLIASVFALFDIGAVPVVADPGMGLRQFLRCVARTKPRALVGIPTARLLSRVFRTAFRDVAIRVAASGDPLDRLRDEGRRARGEGIRAQGTLLIGAASGDSTAEGGFHSRSPDSYPSSLPLSSSSLGESTESLAAILFTSGSTGPPKGVCYTRGMFDAQVASVRGMLKIEPGEIDFPLLPVFALFNPALGMTTIVPEIDPRRPAAIDPERAVRALRQEGVTNSFGSPTLWRKIGDHCRDRGITLPSLRRVLLAGAPVPPRLWETLASVISNGRAWSPYGATECLPVSLIGADEVLTKTADKTRTGAGTCVGRPVGGVRVRILAIPGGADSGNGPGKELPPGEIGEVVVTGPTVSREYDALPDATSRAKIRDADGTVWHRMGDAGYIDEHGRLWFCGRVVERVTTSGGTLYTDQIEPIFLEHPRVARAALLGIAPPGMQRPVVAIEPVEGAFPRTRPVREDFTAELIRLGEAVAATRGLREFVFVKTFPVDVRHNAKIHRLKMARRMG